VIDPRAFLAALRTHGVDYYAGVPDSLLKELTACIARRCAPGEHLIAANEGGAVAAAIGHHLATGRVALVYMQTGDRTRARGLLKDARAILAQANDHSALADIADSEARLALATGEPAQALELAEEARRRAAETGNHKAQFDGLITAGRALEALDRRDEALALYESAAKLVETDSGSPGRRREVYGAWADALAAAGRHADAYAVAKRALG